MKLTQYQEQVSGIPTSLAPERTTPDKWQPTSNLPQGSWQKAALYSTAALMPFFALNLTPTQRIEQPKVFSSEQVILSVPRTTQYQGLAYINKPTTTEIVTVDKWYRDTERPNFVRPNTNALTPIDLVLASGQRSERATPDKWQPATNTPLFDLKRNQHLYPTVVSNILPIEEGVELQDAGIYQTTLPLFSVKRTEFLYPSFTVDAKTLTIKERSTPDKWQAKTNEPVFDIRKNQYLYPSFSIDISQLTRAETAKVFSSQSLVLSLPRSTQYQALTFVNQGSLRETITLDKWFKETGRPVWDTRRQQYIYPSFFFHPVPFPNPEVLTLDKWQPLANQPLFEVKRQQFLYQPFAIDVNDLTKQETIKVFTQQIVILSFPRTTQYQALAYPLQKVPIRYHDTYKPQGSNYGDKYSTRASSYSDKYSIRNTPYNDKYS